MKETGQSVEIFAINRPYSRFQLPNKRYQAVNKENKGVTSKWKERI